MAAEALHPRVEVHADAADLATAVAGELVNRIADLQASGEVPQICLTGGTIAEAIHLEAARLADASGVDWGAVDFWFGDERFVPADSPERNVGQAVASFLGPVGVPMHRIHAAPASDAVDSVEIAAQQYAASLPAEFDVLMLGVGPDGHVASLFPGFSELDVTDALAVGVTGSPKPPSERISLTFPALAKARATWFLVSGEAKAGAVAAALGGADLHETPAAGVTGNGEMIWFLDRASASQL